MSRGGPSVRRATEASLEAGTGSASEQRQWQFLAGGQKATKASLILQGLHTWCLELSWDDGMPQLEGTAMAMSPSGFLSQH